VYQHLPVTKHQQSSLGGLQLGGLLMPNDTITISRVFLKDLISKIDRLSDYENDIDTLIFKLVRLRQLYNDLRKITSDMDREV
jgi:hypothetical protein